MQKPQKFFERFLNNNLLELSNKLIDKYEKIENREFPGITAATNKDLWYDSKSISTMKWKEYNVFQFHIEEIHNLYFSISEMINEACEYYEFDRKENKLMLQGWFNINYYNVGKLNWHDHGPRRNGFLHGYYCVNAEPSVTHYKIDNVQIDNINKNNRAILSEMGHLHAMGDWEWEGPRITVAYDVVPMAFLKKELSDQEQHWIPI